MQCQVLFLEANIWDKVETLMRRESDEVWNYILVIFWSNSLMNDIILVFLVSVVSVFFPY